MRVSIWALCYIPEKHLSSKQLHFDCFNLCSVAQFVTGIPRAAAHEAAVSRIFQARIALEWFPRRTSWTQGLEPGPFISCPGRRDLDPLHHLGSRPETLRACDMLRLSPSPRLPAPQEATCTQQKGTRGRTQPVCALLFPNPSHHGHPH